MGVYLMFLLRNLFLFIYFYFLFLQTYLFTTIECGAFHGFEFRFLCAINVLNFMSGRPFAFEFSTRYFHLSQLEIESRNDNSAKRLSRMVSCN